MLYVYKGRLWPASALFWLWLQLASGFSPWLWGFGASLARQLWMRIYYGNSVNFDSERKTHEGRSRGEAESAKRQSLHWLIVVLCSWYGVGSAQRIQTVFS